MARKSSKPQSPVIVQPSAPVGRPSLYDQSYCDRVKELMGQGYSLAACAGDIGVSRTTIYDWREMHPEFAATVGVGEVLRQKWWETRARANAEDGAGNAGMIQFGLKNVAQKDFREKLEIDHNSNVTHKHVLDEAALSDLDPEDVAAMSSMLGRLIERSDKPKGPVN